MKDETVRILFLADTHLGFDSTLNPRIKRRRRSEDFYKNFMLALKPAYEKKIDIVLHGGDLFYRSKIPDTLIDEVFEPIMEITKSGIPFLIVPGNHERSFIPRSLFHTHDNLLIFDEPKTFTFQIKNISIALAGFPFHRENIKETFHELVKRTRINEMKKEYNFLCIHHAVEGAVVGIQNYMFKSGEDVIASSSIPPIFNAALSGHIHRSQIIRKGLDDKPLQVPIVYPGSIERTSFVEREEKKGYYIIEINSRQPVKFIFNELPERPMHLLEIDTSEISDEQVNNIIYAQVKNLEKDSIIQIRLSDSDKDRNYKNITAEYLRSLVPETINISLSIRGRYPSA